jgi:hypothetical protein
MQTTTEGTFRVLGTVSGRNGVSGSEATGGSSGERSESGGDLLLLDRTDHEPVRVASEGYDGALADTVDAVRPGYLVNATLTWNGGDAQFHALDVEKRTLFTYVDAASGMFEAALDVMEEAHSEGVGVHGRPTFSTDGEPNGAVYAFAEQTGERDIFSEISTGTLPLEPLVDRLDEREDCAHEVFVMRPVEHDFVVVYLVLHRDSILADTVRDTYDCPRPSEA